VVAGHEGDKGMNSKLALRNRGGAVLKAALMILLPLSLFVAGGSGQVQKGTLTWNMGLKNIRTNEFISFSAPVKSFTGEQFQIVISPNAGCYSYVIYESADGDDVAVLFAGSMKKDELWYSDVLKMDPPAGAESFYIVASLEEQKALADRITALRSNSGSMQKRALMNELYRIRSEVSQFKETPEKPILMGGAARGTPDKSQGVEFSGLSTYVKTISIEH